MGKVLGHSLLGLLKETGGDALDLLVADGEIGGQDGTSHRVDRNTHAHLDTGL